MYEFAIPNIEPPAGLSYQETPPPVTLSVVVLPAQIERFAVGVVFVGGATTVTVIALLVAQPAASA